LRRTIARLRAKTAMQRWMLAAYQVEIEDLPINWDMPTLPDSYKPEAFFDLLERVLAEAPPNIEALDVSCDEYPCMTMIRFNTAEQVPATYFDKQPAYLDAWREAYPELHPLPTVWKVDCGDGRTEQVMVLHNGSPSVFDDEDPTWPGYYGRYFSRTKTLGEEAACLRP
jgi:hypothetical protein